MEVPERTSFTFEITCSSTNLDAIKSPVVIQSSTTPNLSTAPATPISVSNRSGFVNCTAATINKSGPFLSRVLFSVQPTTVTLSTTTTTTPSVDASKPVAYVQSNSLQQQQTINNHPVVRSLEDSSKESQQVIPLILAPTFVPVNTSQSSVATTHLQRQLAAALPTRKQLNTNDKTCNTNLFEVKPSINPDCHLPLNSVEVVGSRPSAPPLTSVILPAHFTCIAPSNVTLRLTPSSTIHSVAVHSTAESTTTSSTCVNTVLLDTSMLTTSQLPRGFSLPSPSSTQTTSNIIAATAFPAPNLLMSASNAPSCSRVLFQPVGDAPISSVSLGPTDHATLQSAHNKTKFVNLTSGTSNIRLLSSTTIKQPTTANVGQPGESHAFPPQTAFKLNPNVWPPANLVTLQSPQQSFIVQNAPDAESCGSAAPTAVISSSLLTLRPVSTSTSGCSMRPHLSDRTNQSGLLAVNATLSTSALSAPSVLPTSVCATRPVMHGDHGTPLVLRMSQTPNPVPSFSTSSSASLVKPFTLPVSTIVSSPNQTMLAHTIVPTSNPVSLPHMIPVSIAPAKPTCTLKSHTSNRPSSILPHRHTSLFAQPCRKRARKQQLASTVPTTSHVPISPPSSKLPCTATVSVSGSSTVSTIPVSQLSFSSSSSQHSVRASSSSQITPNKLMVTALGTTQTIPLSPRPLSTSTEHGIKQVACSLNIPGSHSSTSNNPQSTSQGFVGIRLLPVRTTTSLPPAANVHLSPVSGRTDPPTPLMVVTPSNSVQIRLASTHTSEAPTAVPVTLPTPTITNPTGATVYVLTSSSSTSHQISSHSIPAVSVSYSGALPITVVASTTTTNQPAYSTATFMMPAGLPSSTGSGQSLLNSTVQVRLRSPTSTQLPCSYGTPFIVDSQPSSSGSNNISVGPTHGTPMHTSCVDFPEGPSRLLSPPPDFCSSNHQAVYRTTTGNLLQSTALNCFPTEIVSELDNDSRLRKSDSCYTDQESSFGTQVGHFTPKRLKRLSEEIGLAAPNQSLITESRWENGEYASRSISPYHPAVDIRKPDIDENEGYDEGALWTTDPLTGLRWVLSGLPTRPSLLRSSSNGRGGLLWRSKASHFLNSSEVRRKPPTSKLATHPEYSSTTKRLRDGGDTRLNMRRRRMAAIRQQQQNQQQSTLDELVATKLSALQRSTVDDLLDLRMKHAELPLVVNPLITSSVLDLTGWRVLSCANNLDLLVNVASESAESLDLLQSRLQTLIQSSPTKSNRLAFALLQPSGPNAASVSADQFERLSTATMLSSLSNQGNLSTSVQDPEEEEVSRLIDRAMELVKGITQRKRCLSEGFRHLKHLTTCIVEHFRPDVIQHVGWLEEHRLSPERQPHVTPLSPLTSFTTEQTSSNVSRTLRRSARNNSPLPSKLKRSRPSEVCGKPSTSHFMGSLCNGFSDIEPDSRC